MIVTGAINTIFEFKRDRATWKIIGASLREELASTEHTFIVIFNYTQEQEYNAVMNIPGLKVVFQSKPARNSVHPGQRRNFVLVFELEDSV